MRKERKVRDLCMLPVHTSLSLSYGSIFGGLFHCGAFSAVFLFKLGKSAVVSFLLEQEVMEEHVCS